MSLRQLVQPGCQNALSGAVSGIAYPFIDRCWMLAAPAASRQLPPLLVRRHAQAYIAPMRRATILALAGILVVAFGAYSAYWSVAAGKIKLAAGDWAQAGAARSSSTYRGRTSASLAIPSPSASICAMWWRPTKQATHRSSCARHKSPASIWPWDFHDFWIDAPGKISALAGADNAPLAKLDADAAEGAVAIAGDGGMTIWLTLIEPKVDAAAAVSARIVSAWLILPAHAPANHTDSGVAVAALLHDVALPAAPPGFGKTIDELGFGITMMGAMPAGKPKEAVTAWRDSGGTLELDHLDLRWGAVGLTESGTLALDADLQPEGSLSGAVSGYEQLLRYALVAAGRVKASDARIARLGLSFLGQPGADGRPQISRPRSRSRTARCSSAPVVKLGKAPHIDW